MLHPDGTPPSPAKSKTAPTAQPPPYPAMAAQSQSQNESQPIYLEIREDPTATRNARVRFFTALIFGFGIWALLGTLFGSVVDFGHHHHWHGGHWATGLNFVGGLLGESAPHWRGHGEWTSLDGCNSSWSNDFSVWTSKQSLSNAKYHSKTSLALDAFARSHLFVAQQTIGEITFSYTQNNQITEHILVDVIAHYADQDDLGYLSVCKIGKKDSSEGVGISVDQQRHKRPRIYFSIVVSLPNLSFKQFETDLPFFTHRFGDLRDSVLFDYLRLKSTNAMISAEGIQALRADIQTSNAAIIGKFRIFDELNLETSNGFIKADTEMLYRSNRSAVYMKTRNAPIIATTDLKLLHPPNEGKTPTGGKYDVEATTSNSKIDLDVIDAPPYSQLNLRSHTSNSPNRVVLPGSYEGSFVAETSPYMGYPRVHKSDESEGKIVDMEKKGRGKVEGSVYWKEENKGRGSVEVGSSNSPVDLHV